MNSLLNRVERIVSTSGVVMSIADSILNLIAPKAMALAGCTPCTNCQRTCCNWVCSCGEAWCCEGWVCYDESCQPC